MDQIVASKSGANQIRWQAAIRDKAFAGMREKLIIETRPEHLLEALRQGSVSTNVFLRKLHNFCLDMSWLPWPLIPKRQWPPVRYKPKRAITRQEHEAIVAREPNSETRSFYELAWFVGGSQSDLATLLAEDICWETRTISYSRRKTGSHALLHFGEEAARLLRRLPSTGPLFPRLAAMHERHRAKEFRRRCLGLGIKGVSLHSYRYAWAERARSCGYPERFAQEALGHNSKAVHRAYARNAKVMVPSLEDYERKRPNSKVIPFPLHGDVGAGDCRPDAPPTGETPSETPASAPPVPSICTAVA
jgi:integrase